MIEDLKMKEDLKILVVKKSKKKGYFAIMQ